MEQDVADDPPVELVAVLRQPAAAVVENAQRGQHHRVLDQRRQVFAVADGGNQALGLLGPAKGMEPAGDEQVLQRFRQRFQRRVRQAEPA